VGNLHGDRTRSEKTLERQRAFWNRAETDRPVWGINLGFFVHEAFPRVMARLQPGPVRPADIPLAEFLQDCDARAAAQRELGDFPCTCAPFPGIPWLEAVAGCPIMASPSSFWAEPCLRDWGTWRWDQSVLENAWTQKLLELMQALVDHSAERYRVSPTLMRGPADMLAAMRGPTQFPLDLIDSPELVVPALEECAAIWQQVAHAQLERIPPSPEGYIALDLALRTWAPDKILWLQEDAMSLLSPTLYRKYVWPIDAQLAMQFPCIAFHLHGSVLWAIDDVIRLPGVDVVELNLEAVACDLEGTFAGWQKIRAQKPLVIWRMYADDFAVWLARVARELPATGLAIQVSVRNLDEARKVHDEFLKHDNHWRS
jgi:hypothetical protein